MSSKPLGAISSGLILVTAARIWPPVSLGVHREKWDLGMLTHLYV